MGTVELTSALFAELAGWQVMKQAREIVAAGRVLDSEWNPPILRGTVQIGTGATRSGLVLKSKSDVENICPCRDSRQKGIICAHAVAVGLSIIETTQRAAAPGPALAKSPAAAPQTSRPATPVRQAKALLRAADGESGEDLAVSLILPPNLPDAITRGNIMLYVEGSWARGRVPLNSLPLDRKFAFTPEDARLVDELEKLGDGDTPGLLRVNADQFTSVLEAAADHPRITLGKAQKVIVQAEPARLAIAADLQSTGEIVLQSAGLAGQVFGTKAPWVLKGNVLQPLSLPPGCEGLLRGPVRISRNDVPLFVSQSLPALESVSDVKRNFEPEDFELAEGQPRFRLQLTGGIAMLQAKIECWYGDRQVNGAGESFWIPDPANPKRYVARNPALEHDALVRLVRAGFNGPDAQGVYHLKNQEQILNFFARDYPRMQRDWETTMEERLQKSTANNIERIEPRFQITHSGEEWFDLQVSYGTRSGQQLSPADVQRLLRSGQSHTRLPNGKFAVIDTSGVEEFTESLVDCAPEQRGGIYRIKQAQAGFLQSTIEKQQGWRLEASAQWATRTARQTGQAKPTPPQLGALESVLRPYQKEGVAWLRFLRENRFGGILADDMGLGKTLQVLAHLAVLRRENPAPAKPSRPCLVVCPSSLVFNWSAEVARFTPELRAIAIEGAERQASIARIPEHDLVITSYALLRRDAEHYRGMQFDTVVLDEAQHIKNRETQNAQAVKAIRCDHRLVLTGTPLENSVLDLWSIFDFLMPGYLGTAKDFKERYEVPIAKERNGAAQDRLARRIRPFMLRRLKRDVAKDLPEKIEQVSYCDMTEAQASLYRQMLEASRNEITNAVDTNGVARSRMVVLTALLRLRQICCDPRLLRLESNDGQGTEAKPAAASAPGSGKFEMFSELIEEILDGGHRVLVFSQFTSMLGLLREKLQDEEIPFCYLDGSTKDRAGVVQKFQTDSKVPVFLISLKAGGVGLNLTGADTVIHFDPWWNPAVEAQATDRAHRIGQKQVVTSYKLITRGTVEEKILKLQQRKQTMLSKMLGDEQQFAESLSWDEIQELISA